MKITVDVPRRELEEAIRFTRARTKGEAIVEAVADFNRRMRVAELVSYAGTCDGLMTQKELRALRRRA